MSYSLQERLVIGVASSAVFDLRESHNVFLTQGEAEYRRFQRQHLEIPFSPGIAFPFVKRILSLNDLSQPNDPLVEVILLSRNDPDTGLRAMRSIAYYELGMSRAIFMQGKSPYNYIPALNISLFLSANQSDVEAAIQSGYPAGLVLESNFVDDDSDTSLRIAFDFDGVVASDEAEAIFQSRGIAGFHDHEVENMAQPLHPGPLKEFLVRVSKIQMREEEQKLTQPKYENRLRVSIVTARNAPSHERALKTLESWGVNANDAFFLGGIDKSSVLSVLRPHIFFDDQRVHLDSARSVVPSVHIPFGVVNDKN